MAAMVLVLLGLIPSLPWTRGDGSGCVSDP